MMKLFTIYFERLVRNNFRNGVMCCCCNSTNE